MTYASENRHWLGPYILDIAQRMGITHWKIELMNDEPEDAQAQVWLREDSLWARVLVREPHNMADLRDSIVHEMLHIHLHNLEGVFEDVREYVGEIVWHVVEKRQITELEQAITLMTRAWAPHLPLPKRTKA